MGEIEGEAGCSLSRAAVTVRGVNGSGSTARSLRCLTKATSKVGAIQVKVGVVEEVGGGYGRRQSSCSQSVADSDRRGSRYNIRGEVFVGSYSGRFGDLGG